MLEPVDEQILRPYERLVYVKNNNEEDTRFYLRLLSSLSLLRILVKSLRGN